MSVKQATGTDEIRLAAPAAREAGLCVLPARREGNDKWPEVSWKKYQKQLPSPEQVTRWFKQPRDAMCIVCGIVSGNLEIIDFDFGGEAFEPWRRSVEAISPGLVDRLFLESTPSGGRHIAYRSQSPVSGNTKLAQRRIEVESAEPVVIGSKEFVPRQEPSGQWVVVITLIETRGEGGLCLCAPSEGYKVLQGDLCNLPVISSEEREIVLDCARALDELPKPIVGASPIRTRDATDTPRPGDDFNQRGDPRPFLLNHGWTLTIPGENEHWCRPGKIRGTSATLKNGVFYVFSTNAAPFEAEKGYPPFSVYAFLEHHGDFAAAASALKAKGYGGRNGDVRSSGSSAGDPAVPTGQAPAMLRRSADPGLLPPEMLRVPGFVSEVMDHCLETAPYPNLILAFCGAITLQAFLAGRKVRDAGDNRTNIYVLGLAHSSAGKDSPRKVNTRIMHEVGLSASLGERFASGEGIQDALFNQPSMLFQTDEIDGLLQSINKARDARHEAIMSTLLTMYSSSNSVFPMRRRAGKEAPGVIDQPNMVIFGTAIPNHYYEALSERMLTNGFFARMLILEAGQRGAGQEPSIRDLPSRVIETARWWSEFSPGKGNFEHWHPIPKVVPHTEAAKGLLVEMRHEAEVEYAKAEAAQDAVGTTVWGRVSEQVRKLALLHAISADARNPSIDANAVNWARQLVVHQTRRMLFMAADHVAETPFHAECLKLMKKLRDAPGRRLPHHVLLKRMKMRAADFRDLIDTLVERGDIQELPVATGGRTAAIYVLVEEGPG
ncbi:MAG: DUF3987 domain-containing protein [Phycisphaerales bacterium]|nr:DUF3987 domain-containing protein [Phycisphaerales bacterium]